MSNLDKAPPKGSLVDLTALIISAYVKNNAVVASALPQVIGTVHNALADVTAGKAPQIEQKPAVSPKKSLTPSYLICLEDGKRFKSLKRHLRASYDMSPEEYRRKWGLEPDYPMVAPNYAKTRSALAKKIGLGRRHED